MCLKITFSEIGYALITGFDYDDRKYCPKTEVMYVNGTTKVCKSSADYPKNVSGLTGGSFLKNNLIAACGGGYPPTSACYSMSNDLKWTNFANLTKSIWAIASANVKNGLWVTGNCDKFYLKSLKIML